MANACTATLLITERSTKEVHALVFLNKIAAYLRNVSTSGQGTEKEIATQESSRTAGLESGRSESVGFPSLGPPPPAPLSKTCSPTLYCESILQRRHSSFLSYPADKAGISHSYQNKGESSQSGRGYLSSAGILYSLHGPSHSTSTTVSPPLGYQMCMAQFGMRGTQINILPQECKGERSWRVSKGNIPACVCIAAVPPLPRCRCVLWHSTPRPYLSPDRMEHGGDCRSAVGLSSDTYLKRNRTCTAPQVLHRCWNKVRPALRLHESQLLLGFFHHLLFMFPNPFVFPFALHTHTCNWAATLSQFPQWKTGFFFSLPTSNSIIPLNIDYLIPNIYIQQK